MHLPHTDHSLLSKINSALLYASLVVVPLLFFPFLQDVFEVPKLLWILVCLIISTVTWSIQLFKQKEFSLSTHSFLLPLVLLMISVIASGLFAPVTFAESLSSVAGQLFFLSLWAIIATSVTKKINTSVFLQIALAVGVILSLITALQLFDLGPTLVLNNVFGFHLAEKFQFTPVGSPLMTLTLLIPLALAALTDVIFAHDPKTKLFEISTAIILTLSIFVHAFYLFPGKPDSPVLLPFQTNWVIAVESLKSFKLLSVGVGPTSFGDAFTRNRNVELNVSPVWNVVFQVGSNTPLTLLVTIGAIGMFAWFFFFVQAIRLSLVTPKEYRSLAVLVLSIFVIQLFFPPNLVVFSIQILAAIAWVVALKASHHHTIKEMLFHFASLRFGAQQEREFLLSPVMTILSGGLIGFIGVVGLFFFSKNALASYFFAQSMNAFVANDAVKTYQLQQRAIKLRPYFDGYHREYARTNFIIANSLANKSDATEDDAKNVAQLMQQSIGQIRVAAQLNPINSQNYKVMAEIYRSLVGSVKDAEQFSQAAYIQAIQLNPYDPVLRADLGALFVQLKNYDQGASLFQQSAQLKPDYASAYYNWGKTLEIQGRYESAVEAYKQTLRLLENAPQSPNRDTQIDQIKQELGSASDKLVEAQKKAQGSLQSPPPVPSEISTQPKQVNTPEKTQSVESLLQSAPEVSSASARESSFSATPRQ